MPQHKRSFHLHVTQDSVGDEVRWMVTRSLWCTGKATQSALLARGTVEITLKGGSTYGIAQTLLRVALAEMISTEETDAQTF